MESTSSATPTTVPDPFLISAIRPRTAVAVVRISHILVPLRRSDIQGSAMTNPFISPPREFELPRPC